MPEPEPNGPRWEVICSPINAEIIRQLWRRASRSGRGEAVTAAFRQIMERLQRDPAEAGEPSYRLPAMRLQVRRVVVRPLVVDFAVSEDHPLVFIKGAFLLSKQDS
jgi:hypothetical protein